MIFPDKNRYLRDAQSFTVIPVFKRIRADFETPLSIFLKSKGRFLLESIERGENVGRYSIIACGQKAIITLYGNSIEIQEDNGRLQSKVSTEMANPLDEVRRYFSGLKTPSYEGLPPFHGGAIGYLGYETVQYFEKIPVCRDESGIPDGILVIPETLLIYDSVNRSICLVITTMPGADAPKEYERTLEKIDTMSELLQQPLTYSGTPADGFHMKVEALTKKEDFLAAVEVCKRYIREGEIIQAVLSQPFMVETDVPPFSIYQALRAINPSPYLFYLDFANFSLIGSSPEVMVKVQNRELLTRPIAGTRKRGNSVSEDDRLAKELLADTKEKAEHMMLVDLARNDLGRVAAPGSVEVTDFMTIEKYSHVMHIVSTVKAELDEKRDVFDVIRATFPAGTLSGAPKIRAMEIISELEGRRRGPYGGLVCYLGFNGNFDSCITIRTILLQGKCARIQAGAGIVADSVPENEYAETVNKAQALLSAIKNAAKGGANGIAD